MIKKTILSLLLICLGAGLSSCVKDDMSDCPPIRPVRELNFQFKINPVSDIQVTDEFKTVFVSGDAVGIFAVKRLIAQNRELPKTTGNYVDNAKWIHRGGDNWNPATESDKIFYPADGSILDIYAYFPYQEGEVDPTNIHYIIPVEQAFTSGSTAPSLLSAAALAVEDVESKADSDTVTLAFNHLLSLIQLEVTSPNKDYINSELIGLHREVVLDFSASNIADQLTELKGELANFKMETITAGPRSVFRVAAIPQTILEDQNLFKIIDSNGDIQAYSHDDNVQLYSGKKQVFQFAPTTIHKVTFDSQGGSSVDPIFVDHYSTISQLVASPERQGFNFLGWYKDAAGTQIWDFETDRVTSDITLYAQWSISQVSVTFNSQGGTPVDGQIVNAGSTVTKPSPDPQYPSHTFKGWTRDIAGNEPWDFAADIVIENIVLYAQWEIIVHTVTFDPQNGDQPMEVPVRDQQFVGRPAPDPTWPNHIFIGWFKDTAGTQPWDFDNEVIIADITLYGKWVSDSYIVTFIPGNGQPSTTQEVAYNALIDRPTDPVWAGNNFLGWFQTPARTLPWDFDNDRVTSDITLYGQWSVIPVYTVTFNSQGGSEVPEQVVPEGEFANSPDAPERSGYRFNSWNTQPDGSGVAWDFTSTPVTEDITLYAQWEPIIRFAVAFVANGGTPAPPIKTVDKGELVPEPGPIVRDGYIFGGWFNTWDFSGPVWDFNSNPVTGNTILYAKWAPIPVFTVTFNTNGGSPTPSSQSVESGGRVVRPANPLREDYVFVAWYSTPELTGLPWDFNNNIVDSNITLYARWLQPARNGEFADNPRNNDRDRDRPKKKFKKPNTQHNNSR